MMEENKKILKKLRKEYLKSYYSINSYIGCTINCAYCFLAPIKIVPMRPIRVADEAELIGEMLQDPLFERGKTVISLNNRTDPFINDEVKQSTFALLRIMNEENIKNPVTITTKGVLTEEDVKYLDSFTNLCLIIIVTYNGIPTTIQPIPAYCQEQTMQHASRSDRLLLLHQLRPIIPGINDDQRTIKSILDFAMQYCNATIYQGLRINAKIDERLKECQYHFSGEYDKHKQKSKFVDEIFALLQEQYVKYPIFDHTSCAISYLLNMADYNLHFMKKVCDSNCKNYVFCRNCYTPCEDSAISDFFVHIGISDGWFIANGEIIVDGSITDEQKSYIRHIMHRNVTARKREYSFSEQLMD